LRDPFGVPLILIILKQYVCDLKQTHIYY
jgi:hypothetical protein